MPTRDNSDSRPPVLARGGNNGYNHHRRKSSMGPSKHNRNGMGQKVVQEEHSSVKNFNSNEVKDFLNKGYLEAYNKAINPQYNGPDKPTLYACEGGEWKTAAPAWGKQNGILKDGKKNFLQELRKGVGNLN